MKATYGAGDEARLLGAYYEQNSYDIGDQARLTAAFYSQAGALSDPSVVTLTIKDPGGHISTPAVVRDSLGLYHYDLSLNLAGTWMYRWQGSANPMATGNRALVVRPALF